MNNVTNRKFTGYADKKGNKIYENDILFIDKKYDSPMLKVATPKKFVVVETLHGWRGEYDDGWCVFYIEESDFSESEVIGNIYENIDLLGEEQ